MVVKSRPVFFPSSDDKAQGITAPKRRNLGLWMTIQNVPPSLITTIFILLQGAIINFYCVKALNCWNLFATVAKVILTNTHGLI